MERDMVSTFHNATTADLADEFGALKGQADAIEDRLSLDDITPRGQIVRFAVDETFLRANPQDRLAVTEKLLQLQLIDLNQAKEMEGLTPDGSQEADTPDVQ